MQMSKPRLRLVPPLTAAARERLEKQRLRTKILDAFFSIPGDLEEHIATFLKQSKAGEGDLYEHVMRKVFDDEERGPLGPPSRVMRNRQDS
jgi:hypothetical protein